jgi:predicted acyl esterase
MMISETASFITSDGVRLDADIYRPQATGTYPVLLMRQPYGRAIASTVVYNHPRWYAAQGYIVVIQDVRGRGTSEGEFKLFADEVQDGLETVNWAANLPGSSGKVGMYGFSYQGMTQLYAASAKPTALKTICPAMIAYDLYQDWAYENNAFCLQINLAWAIQLATETARIKGMKTAYNELYKASRNLPLFDPIPALPEILKEFAPDSFYHDWINHPQNDEYWQQFTPQLKSLNLPILHIGGWFDPYLRGTLNCYQNQVEQNSAEQHLIIGPWSHLPWGKNVGELDYGTEAINPIDELQIRWFDYFLKGIDTGILSENPISVFDMGACCWRELAGWKFEQTQYFYLLSTGLAAIREDDGILLEIAEEVSPNLSNNLPTSASLELEEIAIEDLDLVYSEDIFVHDPWRPVPSLGGHAAIPAGAMERSKLDNRSDILTYTSAPLKTDLLIIGQPKVEIYCEADTPSFDLCAVLSVVQTNGKVYNFTQGYIRLNQQTRPITIPLQATCMQIQAGNAIRLSVSAACFPAYPVNPGIDQPLSQTQLIEAQIITLRVQCGGEYASRVILPITTKE